MAKILHCASTNNGDQHGPTISKLCLTTVLFTNLYKYHYGNLTGYSNVNQLIFTYATSIFWYKSIIKMQIYLSLNQYIANFQWEHSNVDVQLLWLDSAQTWVYWGGFVSQSGHGMFPCGHCYQSMHSTVADKGNAHIDWNLNPTNYFIQNFLYP